MKRTLFVQSRGAGHYSLARLRAGDLLSPSDVAAELGVTRGAVWAATKRGTLRAVARTRGGIRLYWRRDVRRARR